MSVNYHLYQNLFRLKFKMKGYYLPGFPVLKFDTHLALQRGVMVENHHKRRHYHDCHCHLEENAKKTLQKWKVGYFTIEQIIRRANYEL